MPARKSPAAAARAAVCYSHPVPIPRDPRGPTVRTLITGGAGFIGSHLCERFLAEGHEVICVDNIITGDLGNIDPLRANERFSFRGHDISHPLEVEGPIDHVLHFASPASPV